MSITVVPLYGSAAGENAVFLLLALDARCGEGTGSPFKTTATGNKVASSDHTVNRKEVSRVRFGLCSVSPKFSVA